MASMPITFVNSSAEHPMRLCIEDRKTAQDITSEADTAPSVPPPNSVMTEAEHTEYMARGQDMVPGKNGAGHDIELPRWRANGFSSLPEYVTALFQATLRPQYQGPPRKAVRVLNEWKAPVPVTTVPPGGRVKLTLTVNRRIVAECAGAEDAGLCIENVDPRQTIRLRSRHIKTGAEEQVAFLSNGNTSGAVTLNKSTAAIVELMPS